MSWIYHVRFPLFVDWNICFIVVVVMLIFMLSVRFRDDAISRSCFSLKSNLRLLRLIHRYHLQCWRVLFLLFFRTNALSLSSLGCKTSNIVTRFFVLRSIFLRSFFNISRLVHSISQGNCPGVYTTDDIPVVDLLLLALLYLWEFFSTQQRITSSLPISFQYSDRKILC